MSTTFPKKKDQLLHIKSIPQQVKASFLNNHNPHPNPKYQKLLQHKPGESKTKVNPKTIASLNKLLLSSKIGESIASKATQAKFSLKKNPKTVEKQTSNNNNHISSPSPIPQLSLNVKNQMRIHNKNSTSLHISNNNNHNYNTNSNTNSNSKQTNQINCPLTTIKPQGKITYSYCNTISSTNNNTDNNNNNFNNAQVELRLISIIDQIQSEDTTKVELLDSNIFLNKLISYFSNLLSPDYFIRDLIKSEDIKIQFSKLEHKVNYYSQCNNYSNLNANTNANVINADMLSSDYISETNPIAVESNNRKDVYRTFFDFFDEISKEIKDISVLLPEPQELKRIDEVNSKISSLHSRITLTNRNIDCNESSIHTNNMYFYPNEQPQLQMQLENGNLNITKENITNLFLKQTLDLMSDQVPSLLISSINSEFYQQLIDDSIDISNICKKQTVNEKKEKKNFQPCDYLTTPLAQFDPVVSPISNNNKAPITLKEDSKISDKTILNEESCYDQSLLDEMKASTINIKPNDYCHTKEEFEHQKIKSMPLVGSVTITATIPEGIVKLPVIKKNDDNCILF